MSYSQEKEWLLKEKYAGKKSFAYYLDLLTLRTGYPLAYLIGNVPFLSLKIDLSMKPLIPRPETEFWVYDRVFPFCTKRSLQNNKLFVLDIFSGSGCVGLSIAKHYSNFAVYLSDFNSLYLKQIHINAQLNNIHNVKIIDSDVFSNIKGRFDIITANPPYVSTSVFDSKASFSVKFFEDKKSVFTKDHGLFFIKKILKESPAFLKPGGKLFMEFDPWQKEKIQTFIKESRLMDFLDVNYYPDQYGKYRVLEMTVKLD